MDTGEGNPNHDPKTGDFTSAEGNGGAVASEGEQTSAPQLPPSGHISTMAEAKAYWNTHFKGKTYDLTVHSRKAPDKGGHVPKKIKVNFGTTNHAYSEKPEGASHHNDERELNLERAKMMDKIIPTIEHPQARLVSRGHDVFISAPIQGRYYSIFLKWNASSKAYEFQSAHFRPISSVHEMQQGQRTEARNNGPLQQKNKSSPRKK